VDKEQEYSTESGFNTHIHRRESGLKRDSYLSAE
jgi:hypothetical protein